MDLSNIKPAKGSIKKRKRIARGQGSGKGGTSTKGHKGQKSRSGYSQRIGGEGGQMPMLRRMPKYGFKNINRIEYKAVNIGALQELADRKKVDAIDINLLAENGMVSKKDKVKILGNGELNTKLDVTAHAFSKTAKEAIEEKGGKVIII